MNVSFKPWRQSLCVSSSSSKTFPMHGAVQRAGSSMRQPTGMQLQRPFGTLKLTARSICRARDSRQRPVPLRARGLNSVTRQYAIGSRSSLAAASLSSSASNIGAESNPLSSPDGAILETLPLKFAERRTCSYVSCRQARTASCYQRQRVSFDKEAETGVSVHMLRQLCTAYF